MPFLSQAGFGDAVRRSLMLLGVSAIYLARAWTEERHLGRDPTYRRYARWIDRRGLFAPLGRVLPFLRFGRRFPDPG